MCNIWSTIAILHTLTIREKQRRGEPREDQRADPPEGVNVAKAKEISDRMERVPFTYTALVDGTVFTENEGRWRTLRNALVRHLWLIRTFLKAARDEGRI